MGFFKRIKHLARPRASGSGKLWDNINSGGSAVSPLNARVSQSTTTPVAENYFQPGPNPEPNLVTGMWKDPYRLHSAPDTGQPVIAVRYPNVAGVGFTYNDPQQQSSTAQPLQAQAPVPKTTPAILAAPSQIINRENKFDGANPDWIRADQAYTDSQRYFNQRVPIQEFTTPYQWAHGIYCNIYPVKQGWMQSEVPEPGMTANAIGNAPPLLLSRPLNVRTTQTMEIKRSPMKGAKAPKRVRSGS